MTRLESEKVVVNKSPEEVLAFLSDFNNVGSLMPQQVENFKVTDNTCSFTIKGMATLGLAYESRSPGEVVMQSHGKVPFDFKLISRMEEREPGKTEVQLLLDAELNPFLKMMAEKPLTNFLNMLVKRFSDQASA